MSQLRTTVRALIAATVLLAASTSSAQIVSVVGATEAFRSGFVKLDVAFDSLNRVYLVVWGSTAPNPVMGVIVNRAGSVIHGPFSISDFATEGHCGYPRVVFGGTSGNETFLVEYTSLNQGTNPRRARLVRYSSGPQVGAPIEIDNLFGAWPDSDLSTPTWTGRHFLVTWRKVEFPFDETYVRGIDASGNYTTAVQKLGDQLDAQANPSIACDPASGKCLAVGFAWGVPFGNDAPGGTWSRFFDAQTAAPIGSVTYLDCPAGRPGCAETLNGVGIREDQRVVFNSKTGAFQSVWVFLRNFIEGRQVRPDGSKGPLEQIAGPHLGQLSLTYNPGSSRTLLTYKDWTYALASELDDAGHVVNPTQPLVVSSLPDDLGSTEFDSVAAANGADSQWLIAYQSHYRSGRVMVAGTSNTPPAASPTISGVSPSTGPVAGGTTVTITGTQFQAGATVSFGGAAAAHVTVVSSTQITATTPSQAAATVTVNVTVPGGQSASLAGAFRYVQAQAGDFNGDGQADLVWRNGATGQVIVWYMNGSSYSGWAQLNVPLDGNWTVLGTADFSGDGRPDLVLRNRVTGENRMAVTDGNGGVTLVALDTQPDLSWKGSGVGDFNGDGKTDIVWRNIMTGENVVWYMNGAAIAGAGRIPTVGDVNWRIGAVADFNGDARPDLVWHNVATGQNMIWFMNGVAFVDSMPLETNVDLGWRVVGAEDLNGDGKADILWRNVRTGDDCVWLMNGPTHFGTNALPTVAGADWQLMGVRDDYQLPAGPDDINGDGNNDIVWRNIATGEDTVWYLSGTSFAASAVLPAVADLDWRIAATADFNGDGKVDFLWRHLASGRTLVWFMNATTYLDWAELPSAGAEWQIVGVADFNRDGKPDIAWRNAATGQAVVWYMSGTAQIGSASLPYVTDTSWRIVAVSDFNSDGGPDLLWQNSGTNQLIVWYLNGNNYVDFAWLDLVGDLNWRVVAARDFDRDGKPDLLWRNQATGANQIWRMSGTTYLGSVFLPTEPSAAWRVIGLP